MAVTTVLFDFGGTLVDQSPFLKAANDAAVDGIMSLCCGGGITRQTIWRDYDVIRRVVMRMIRTEVDPCRYEQLGRKLIYALVLALHGAEPTESDLNSILQRMIESASACPCVFPATETVLRQLKPRFKLGIVSNGLAAYTRGNLAALGLLQYFETIVISEEENVEKPDGELFARALTRMGSSPGETVMVGNMLYEDVCGAHAAGLRAVWLRSGEPQRKVRCPPEVAIDDIADLPGALERLSKGDLQ